MSRKRKILSGVLAGLGIFILALVVAPVLYQHHATGELTRQLDEKYEKNGDCEGNGSYRGRAYELLEIHKVVKCNILVKDRKI